MSYATPADLYSAFSQTEIQQLQADEAKQQERLDEAHATVNAHIAKAGYAVPLSNPPADIKAAECKLARYALYPAGKDYDENGKPTPWRQGWLDAMALLEKIAAGDIPILTASGTALAKADGQTPPGGFRVTARTGNKTNLEGY